MACEDALPFDEYRPPRLAVFARSDAATRGMIVSLACP